MMVGRGGNGGVTCERLSAKRTQAQEPGCEKKGKQRKMDGVEDGDIGSF